MLRIEPLGTGVFLPAFVVGYELPYGADNDEANRTLDRMPLDENLVVLDHQAGGYCMRYPTVAGAVLRLDANDGNGKRPFCELVRAFRLMAEDPDLAAVEAEFPNLRGLVYTVGDAYTKIQLHRVQSFVRRFAELPTIESGIEAFVRLELCDVLYYFGGWQALSCRLAGRKSRRGSSQQEDFPTHYTIEQGNVSDLARDDTDALDEGLLGRITRLGEQIGVGVPPRVFLLWENSD